MTWSTIDNKELADTKATIAAQEDMLTHASTTIARLEGRRRAPGAARAGQISLVIQQGTLARVIAACDEHEIWLWDGEPIAILAWHELPAIPSEDGFKELT